MIQEPKFENSLVENFMKLPNKKIKKIISHNNLKNNLKIKFLHNEKNDFSEKLLNQNLLDNSHNQTKLETQNTSFDSNYLREENEFRQEDEFSYLLKKIDSFINLNNEEGISDREEKNPNNIQSKSIKFI